MTDIKPHIKSKALITYLARNDDAYAVFEESNENMKKNWWKFPVYAIGGFCLAICLAMIIDIFTMETEKLDEVIQAFPKMMILIAILGLVLAWACKESVKKDTRLLDRVKEEREKQ